jgi:hypothetical protein
MISRWLCVGLVALAALVPGGCAHKRCCPSPSTSAYPCCPQPPCGGVGPMAPVAPVTTQAFSGPVGAPGCCNGR